MALLRKVGTVALALCWSSASCAPAAPAVSAPAAVEPVAPPVSITPPGPPPRPEPAPAPAEPGSLGIDSSQLPQSCAEDRAQQRQAGAQAAAPGELPPDQNEARGAALRARLRAAANPNYRVHVREDNQRPLEAVRADFKAYLAAIHDRVHPHFSLQALPRLGRRSCSDAINNYDLHVDLELVVSSTDGQLLELGIVRTSGVDAFDELALEAVLSGAPFGKPPASIVSGDGNVYVRWGLHRNPLLACSTYFAEPFLI